MFLRFFPLCLWCIISGEAQTTTTTTTTLPPSTLPATTPSTTTTTTTTISQNGASTTYCNNYRDVTKDWPRMGDLGCRTDFYEETLQNGGELVLRETIVKAPVKYATNITYVKNVSSQVANVNVLNIGETCTFVQQIVIRNGRNGATVSVSIEVPERQEPKLFVEIYSK